MRKEELRKEMKRLKMESMLDNDKDKIINYQNKLIDILPENPEYIDEYKDLSIFKLENIYVETNLPKEIEGKFVLDEIRIDLGYHFYKQVLTSHISCFILNKTKFSCKYYFLYINSTDYQFINFLDYKIDIGYYYNIDLYLLIKIIINYIKENFKSIIISNPVINVWYDYSRIFKFRLSKLENYNNINKFILPK